MADGDARAAALATILEWGREEKRRREERLREAVVVLDGFRRDLEAARAGQPPRGGESAPPGGGNGGSPESPGVTVEDLEELIRSFEGEMVEPLRKDIEAAEDFLVRCQGLAAGSGGGRSQLDTHGGSFRRAGRPCTRTGLPSLRRTVSPYRR